VLDISDEVFAEPHRRRHHPARAGPGRSSTELAGGAGDSYRQIDLSLTRSTQTLTILHAREVPSEVAVVSN
jgi:hypothetical protein